MHRLRSIFAWTGRLISRLFAREQHVPELTELEADYDKQLDPERVRDRQFSTSIRSGRG